MSWHVSTPPGLDRLGAAWRAVRPSVKVERTLEASDGGVRFANLMIDVEWPILSGLWSGGAARRSLAFYFVQRRAPATKVNEAERQ